MQATEARGAAGRRRGALPTALDLLLVRAAAGPRARRARAPVGALPGQPALPPAHRRGAGGVLPRRRAQPRGVATPGRHAPHAAVRRSWPKCAGGWAPPSSSTRCLKPTAAWRRSGACVALAPTRPVGGAGARAAAARPHARSAGAAGRGRDRLSRGRRGAGARRRSRPHRRAGAPGPVARAGRRSGAQAYRVSLAGWRAFERGDLSTARGGVEPRAHAGAGRRDDPRAARTGRRPARRRPRAGRVRRGDRLASAGGAGGADGGVSLERGAARGARRARASRSIAIARPRACLPATHAWRMLRGRRWRGWALNEVWTCGAVCRGAVLGAEVLEACSLRRRRTKVRGAPMPPSVLLDSVVTASSLPSWRSSWLLSWPSLIPPFSGVGCASDRTASGLDRWPPGPRDRPARCLPLRDHPCASLAADLRGGELDEAFSDGLKEVGGDPPGHPRAVNVLTASSQPSSWPPSSQSSSPFFLLE